MTRITSIDVGSRNLCVANVLVDRDQPETTFPFTDITWEVIDLKSNNNINALTCNLIQELYKRDWIYECDFVVIESQGYGTACMQRLMTALYAHFLSLKMVFAFEVAIVSPHGKFTVYRGPPIKLDREYRQSDYTYRKKIITAQMDCLLEKREDLKDFIDSYRGLKKKDDLCDAIFQAAYFIRHHLPTYQLSEGVNSMGSSSSGLNQEKD